MVCPTCHCGSLSGIPAEIRFHRNGPRTLSYPPLMFSQNVQVCLNCGRAEFSVPQTLLSSMCPLRTLGKTAIAPSKIDAVSRHNRAGRPVRNFGLDEARLQISLEKRCVCSKSSLLM